jgi:alkaline phosphatase D
VRNSSRRRFLRRSLAAGALVAARPLRVFGQAPALVTPESARPQIPFGTSVGDVVGDRAILWAKSDRPARLIVEYSTSELIKDLHPVMGPAALEQNGFTARVDLTGCRPASASSTGSASRTSPTCAPTASRPTAASSQAPVGRRDVLFAWSADVCGQGWGIDPARGGMRLFDAMRRAGPDFFVHVGDTIYADNPLPAEVKLDDGTLWKNIVTPAKSKVAETLDEFRGNHAYNLLDENVRRFNKEVAQVVMWDDHEVRNDWWPTQILDDPKYQVKSVALLAARAKRAFFEHYPIRVDADENERIYRAIPYGPSLELFALDMRSYRGANGPNRQPARGDDSAILGETQLAWLKSRLAASKATWKVIASDMPLGLIVPTGTPDKPCAFPRDAPPLCEAVANGAAARRSGANWRSPSCCAS